MTRPYCEALGIDVPSLESVRDHEEAGPYSLLIVALLERGSPMTLAEVAGRFDEAGIAPAANALVSLKRCRPARAPVYRDGDEYALDPHDDELDFWAFRLGLRPCKATNLRIVPAPLPSPDQPVTLAELDEAWRDHYMTAWSAQRIALAILEAHGDAMPPEAVVAFADEHCERHKLATGSPRYWYGRSPIRVREDGRWEIRPGTDAQISAREAVRTRLAVVRRNAALRPDPVVSAVNQRIAERRRTANAAELASLRRVLVHTFPADDPQAVALLDVGARTVTTFLAGDLERARAQLATFDLIGAVEVRPRLRALGFDIEDRRLAELGPPQKSISRNERGRALKLTTAMVIQGSCGITRPLGDPRELSEYLRKGQTTRLARRLEADVKALLALYEYGRLHGAVRIRWRDLDDMLPVPWVHPDEERLYHWIDRAHAEDRALEVVVGTAPDWSEPWARAQRCFAVQKRHGYGFELVDEGGYVLDLCDVQRARLASPAAR